MRISICFLCAWALVGCSAGRVCNGPGLPSCECLDDPTLPSCGDGGGLDAGPDAGPDARPPDAGPCGGACDAARCVDDACVDCTVATQAADCTDGDAILCDPSTNTCVACLSHADCTADATLPICDAGDCRGCAADTDCASMAATPACDEPTGRCVECTVDSEASTCGPPDNRACHPTDLTCTGAGRGSLGFCSACVSDSECLSDASNTLRCVPTQFEGSAHGTYCLVDQTTLVPAGPCPDRMANDRLATSVGGVESTFCFIQEARTTCEAVLGFNALCPGGDDDCGAPGLDDGSCQGGRCTYECISPSDCGSGMCTGGGTQYCE